MACQTSPYEQRLHPAQYARGCTNVARAACARPGGGRSTSASKPAGGGVMTDKPTLGMANAYAYAPEAANTLSEDIRALIARRERLLGPAYRLFYREPLHLVR